MYLWSGLLLSLCKVCALVHVGEELNSWEVLLVLFFPLFPMKLTGGHTPCTCSQGKSLALGPW